MTSYPVHENRASLLATLHASLIGGLLWERVSPAATFYFGTAMAALSTILFMALIVYSKGQTQKMAIP